MSSRSPLPVVRHAIAALAMTAGLIIGPGLAGAALARDAVAAAPPPVTPDPATIGTNPFIPEDANIGDCVSSLPRPECGTDQRGGYHQYLTLIILFLGTIFIGWRVARGVRSRDRALNDPVDQTTPTTKV